jgi:hypothetical protein
MIVWFGKLDHPISPSSGQKMIMRTTVLKMAPTPHWMRAYDPKDEGIEAEGRSGREGKR